MAQCPFHPKAHTNKARLAFHHPLTDQLIELASPLPAELEGFVAYVEQSREREYG